MENSTTDVLLEKFTDLTERLVKSYKISKHFDPRWAEIATQCGKARSFGLLHRTDVAVVYCIMTENTKFDLHMHPNNEYFVLVSGDLTVYMENKVFVLHTGDSLYIRPNVPHYVTSNEGCTAIVLQIPGTVLWPNGEHIHDTIFVGSEC